MMADLDVAGIRKRAERRLCSVCGETHDTPPFYAVLKPNTPTYPQHWHAYVQRGTALPDETIALCDRIAALEKQRDDLEEIHHDYGERCDFMAEKIVEFGRCKKEIIDQRDRALALADELLEELHSEYKARDAMPNEYCPNRILNWREWRGFLDALRAEITVAEDHP